MKRLALSLCLISGATWVWSQSGSIPLPLDTLDHWYAVKRTTEDVAKTYGVLWAAKRTEADSCSSLVESKDRSIADLRRAYASLEAENRANEERYREAFLAGERRKRRAPWVAAAFFGLGLFLGSR
jgi:hypothetical protein